MILEPKNAQRGIPVDQILAQIERNNPNPRAKNLREAFNFDNTAEGRAYWELIDKLYAFKPEPVDKVQEQLQVLPPDIRRDVTAELQKVNYRKNKELKFAFKWGESPQGKTFWKGVYHLIKVYSNGHAKPSGH